MPRRIARDILWGACELVDYNPFFAFLLFVYLPGWILVDCIW